MKADPTLTLNANILAIAINNEGLFILQNQLNQQVTNVSTSLSNALYISRPICSIGTVCRGRLTAC